MRTRGTVRITHRPSGIVLAEGPRGWGVTRFEGNLYVRRKFIRSTQLVPSWMPGVCPYKGLYQWLDLRLPSGGRARSVGWFYWLPNPLLPFIWFRMAFPGAHPDIVVEETTGISGEPSPPQPGASTAVSADRPRPVASAGSSRELPRARAAWPKHGPGTRTRR